MNKLKTVFKDGKKLLVSSFTAATLGLLGTSAHRTVKAASMAADRLGLVEKNTGLVPGNVLKVTPKSSEQDLQNNEPSGLNNPIADTNDENNDNVQPVISTNDKNRNASTTDKLARTPSSIDGSTQSVGSLSTEQIQQQIDRPITSNESDEVYDWGNKLAYANGVLTIAGGTIDNSASKYNLSIRDYVNTGRLAGVNSADDLRQIKITKKLTIIGSAANLFSYLRYLTTIEGLARIRTTAGTDIDNMFTGCERLTNVDTSSWTLANKSKPVIKWDRLPITNMPATQIGNQVATMRKEVKMKDGHELRKRPTRNSIMGRQQDVVLVKGSTGPNIPKLPNSKAPIGKVVNVNVAQRALPNPEHDKYSNIALLVISGLFLVGAIGGIMVGRQKKD